VFDEEPYVGVDWVIGVVALIGILANSVYVISTTFFCFFL